MKEYTLEQAVDDCIAMWDWLRKHPDKGKDEYFGLGRYDDFPIENGCAICEYCGVSCVVCPLWPSPNAGCQDDMRSYGGWCNSRYAQLYKRLTNQQLANRRIYATEVLKKALNLKWRIRKCGM